MFRELFLLENILKRRNCFGPWEFLTVISGLALDPESFCNVYPEDKEAAKFMERQSRS